MPPTRFNRCAFISSIRDPCRSHNTGGYDGREAAYLTQLRQQVLLPLRARSRTSRAPTPSAEANADADGDQDSVAAGRARTCPQGVGARLAREADYAKYQANQAQSFADESPAGACLSAATAIPVGATGGYDGREAVCLTQPRHQVLLPLRARSRTSRAPTPSAEANADADANADGDGDGDQDGGGRPILSEGREVV